MTGLLDLKEHLVFYKSYHTDEVNVAIHLFCIPIILLSAIALLATNGLEGHPYLNLGNLIALSYGTYYILLDWKVGIPSAIFYGVVAYVYSTYYYIIAKIPLAALDQHQLYKYALILHVGAWLAQFYGHRFHEHRAPALLDNLVQALVLAPFFVSFEVAFWLGLRTDIKEYMEKGAAAKRQEFLTSKKAQ